MSIFLLLILVSAINTQNIYVLKLINQDNSIVFEGCLAQSIIAQKSIVKNASHIQFETLVTDADESLCSPNSTKPTHPGLIINFKSQCGLDTIMNNAKMRGVRLLVILSPVYRALPAVEDPQLTIVLVNTTVWNSFKGKFKDKKTRAGVYDNFVSNMRGQMLTAFSMSGIVALTILLIICFSIGFHVELLSNVEMISQSESKSVKWLILILPIIIIGSLLLLYFYYNIMVWVFIISFYFLSAHSFANICVLFLQRFKVLPNLVISVNKFGFTTIDLRRVALFFVGLCFSTAWIVNRHNRAGLLLNNLLGMFVCLDIAMNMGLLLACSKNFKVILAILCMVLIMDAVMVFVPIRTSKNLEAAQHTVPMRLLPALSRSRRSADGSSIMESVALGSAGSSSEELPVRFKLAISGSPATSNRSSLPGCSFGRPYSILGYGDLVLPGIFICFMVSFAVATSSSNVGLVLYSCVLFCGYMMGLTLTFVVLFKTDSGQPALIYLIPCTTLPCLLLAGLRRDLGTLWTGDWSLSTNQPQQPPPPNQSAEDPAPALTETHFYPLHGDTTTDEGDRTKLAY